MMKQEVRQMIQADPAQLMTIEGTLHRLPIAPHKSSRDQDWTSLNVDIMPSLANLQLQVPPADHYTVTYALSGSGLLYQKRGGREHSSRRRPGQIMLIPAFEPSQYEGASAESVVLRIPSHIIEENARAIGLPATQDVELMHVFDGHDHVIKAFADILLQEIETPAHPAQQLIIDATSVALSAHLLRTYCAHGTVLLKTRGLSQQSLARVVDYIEQNLQDKLTLDSLAHIAGVSRFHFVRMFKMSTGVSPMAFVESSRIRRAQALIRAGTLPLREVGLLMQFSDQSHFSRRFKLYSRCTPTEYARRYALQRSFSLPRYKSGTD
jgi:AraC family transcriptional regulator